MMKMNVVYSAMMAVCLMALVSCEEHTDIYDNRVSVGNILLSDNTLISPYGYDKDCHQAVGVVFYTSRDTALVVGLRELGEYEYTDSMATVSGVKNDAYSMCGAENTAAIMASEDLYSPAVEAVMMYDSPVSGWALPSAGELRALSASLPVVRHAMEVVGGDPFSDEQYLSSSQDGATSESSQMYYYSVSLRNGFLTSTLKQTPGRVRPVLRIR